MIDERNISRSTEGIKEKEDSRSISNNINTSTISLSEIKNSKSVSSNRCQTSIAIPYET